MQKQTYKFQFHCVVGEVFSTFLSLVNPTKFEAYATHKMDETLDKWASLAGVDGDADEG